MNYKPLSEEEKEDARITIKLFTDMLKIMNRLNMFEILRGRWSVEERYEALDDSNKKALGDDELV